MVAEKDVITLVVEGHATATSELGVVVEERGQHPTHGVTQAGRKVVQDDLGTERRDLAPVFLRRTRETKGHE